jgi:small-conductance mechanosensitive channel
MTPPGSISRELAEAAFLAIRMVFGLVLLTVLAVWARRAVVTFAGEGYRQLGRRKWKLAGANLLAMILLELARGPAEKTLRSVGDAIGPVAVIPDPGWLGGALIGLYHTAAAILGLVLAIQLVGALYWSVEGRLDAWRARIGTAQGLGAAKDVRADLLDAVAWLNRAMRALLLAGLLLSFLAVALRLFPATSPVMGAILLWVAAPGREIGLAILHYLPNLGYLTVIGGLGWLALRLLRYVSRALASGSLTVRGFHAEWAEPTYKLSRTLLLLFLLMVSFPYLPGAGSQFFQGFSVFVGALLTLGSAGAIGNIVAGTVLTYTRAFHPGDMVRLGETYGVVIEKNLLVTRLRTIEHEEVTIPNGSVLSGSVVNFSVGTTTGGFVLTVRAGIGYDVDWRTVHRLLLEGAAQTPNILADPAPQVWQAALGDYAVQYELRAWTDRPVAMFETHSTLRRNVLDAFNRAGVEIMTPSILAHRDASGLAIPPDAFPDPPARRGIAVRVDRCG